MGPNAGLFEYLANAFMHKDYDAEDYDDAVMVWLTLHRPVTFCDLLNRSRQY